MVYWWISTQMALVSLVVTSTKGWVRWEIHSFPLMLGHIPSYPVPSTTFWLPGSLSTGLLISWLLLGSLSGLLGSGEFSALMWSCWWHLYHILTLWMLPGVAVSLPGSSGSSQGLLGEFFSSFLLKHLHSCSDAFPAFFSRFLESLACPGTPNTSASSVVSPSLQLKPLPLSPSSSTLWGSFCHCTGLLSGMSGGGRSGGTWGVFSSLAKVHWWVSSTAVVNYIYMCGARTWVLV